MKIKVMAHDVNVRLIDKFQERTDLTAQHDDEEKIARIQCRSDGGNIRPLSGLLVSFFHEISHEIDNDTGHEIFTSDEDEVKKMREGALEAYSNGLVQVLLDNKIISSEWLEKFKKEIPK